MSEIEVSSSVVDYPEARVIRREEIPDNVTRRPVAAVGIYALGQVVLGVTMAQHVIPVLVGALVSFVWMLCGFLLVSAQAIQSR